jgi:hypothetical protein
MNCLDMNIARICSRKIIWALFAVTFLLSCNEGKVKSAYNGPPIIIQKYKSLTGSCVYTYQGYGYEEWFEDDCDKYEVGDTLNGREKK